MLKDSIRSRLFPGKASANFSVNNNILSATPVQAHSVVYISLECLLIVRSVVYCEENNFDEDAGDVT